MAQSCFTLFFFFFFFFFTISLASHAPTDNDEASHTTQVALIDPNVPVNPEKQFNTFTLTKIPFNRRFLARPKLPCRHSSKARPTFASYGNDMIFPSGDMKEPVVYGGGRRTPGQWLIVHHHHHNHGEDDGGRIKKTAFKRRAFDKEEEKLRILKKHFGDHEAMMMKKKSKSGFMRGTRKFLDHYFNFDV